MNWKFRQTNTLLESFGPLDKDKRRAFMKSPTGHASNLNFPDILLKD